MEKQKGFTLLELAIVIVIIALVAAAVLAGAGLVRKAKVAKLTKDLEVIRQADKNFTDKYNAIAGDFDEAQRYFGASATTNGDGDGNIEITGAFEDLLYWQHLSLAGMYAGIEEQQITAAESYERSDNVPLSNMSPTAVFFVEYGSVYNATGNMIRVGQITGSNVAGRAYGGVLTSIEVHAMDAKIDDGIPSGGNLYGIRQPSPGDAGDCINGPMLTNGVTNNIQYRLLGEQATEAHCGVVFWINKEWGCSAPACAASTDS